MQESPSPGDAPNRQPAPSAPPHYSPGGLETIDNRMPKSESNLRRPERGLFFQGDPRERRVRLARVIGNPDEAAADEHGELDEPVAARLELSDGLQVCVYDAHDAFRGARGKPSGIRIEMEDFLSEVLDARVQRLLRLRLARTFPLLAHLPSRYHGHTYGCGGRHPSMCRVMARPRDAV